MNLILIALAFGLAAIAQALFVKRIYFNEALVLYALAILVVWVLRWGEKSSSKEGKLGASNPSGGGRLRGGISLVAAVALGGFAAHYLSQDWKYLCRALLLYSVGLAFAAYAFSLLESQGIRDSLVRTWHAIRRNKTELLLLGIVLLLGLFLRLHRLNYYPPFGGISWNDEAQMGKDAHEFLQGRAHPWQFPFSVYLPALSFVVLGENVLALRLPFILMGFAMLIPFYLLVRDLFSPRIALVGTSLLAISRWHISFTKLVLPSTPAALLGLLSLYFLFRGLRTGRKMNYAWAGAAVSLGLYSHASFRIVPLIIFTFFLTKVVSTYGALLLSPSRPAKGRRVLAIFRENYQGPLVFLITAFLFVIPFFAIVKRAPQVAFTERFTSVMPILFAADRFNYLRDLGPRIREVFLVFNYRGEGWGAINLPGTPMLDPFTAVLFALGLGYCLFYFWRGENLFFLIWFFFVMIGGGVIVDTFRSHRIFIVIPVVYIFACVTLDWAWREFECILKLRGKIKNAVPVALLMILLFWAAWANYDTFFNEQINAREVRQEFLRDVGAIANHTGSLGQSYYVYLLANFPFYVQGHDFAWMAGDPQGRRGTDITEILPSHDSVQADIVYIFSRPYNVEALSALVRRFYPASEVQVFHGDYDRYTFASCTVQRQEVESLRGLTGRYYHGLDWSGELAFIRKDATISLDFSQPPIPPPFSVQWEGAIYIPVYGEYVFVAESEGKSWVYLDDALLIEGGDEGKATLAMGWHRLKVRYGAREEGGAIRLHWYPPGREREIIPPYAFSIAAPVNGLVGSYYRGKDWTGEPVFKRIDPLVLLTCVPSLWGGRPSPALEGQSYSVKWAGYLRLEREGDYTFQVESWCGGTTVYIDGRKVLEEPGQPWTLSIEQATVGLERGWHEIEVRYSYQDGEFSGVSLYWITPFGEREVVPSDVLYPSPIE